MKKPIAACLAASLALSACAGRKPEPIAEVQASDSALTCSQLRTEMSANTEALKGLLDEKLDKQTKNTVAGTAGVVLFFPALLFMDLKGAAGEEASAYQRRNQGLLTRYKAKRCRPEIKLEEYDARKARRDAKAAELEAKKAATE